MNTKHKGSSLIELLAVVAIILIIAAVAIPNSRRLRMAANELSAVGSMRTMNTAANTYGSTYGNGFPPKPCIYRRDPNRLRRLPQCLLADIVLTSGAKSG